MHCAHFESCQCRSCTLLDRSYETTLQDKQQFLTQLFPDAAIRSAVPCHDVNGSRIRAKLAISGTAENPQLGFYDDSQKIVAIENCPLHHSLINQFALRLPEMIRKMKLTPYCMQTDRGELKFVILTCSPTHQQLMVQFVLRSREAVDRVRSFWRRWPDSEKQRVRVLSINLQPVRTSTIVGVDEILISEQSTLPIRFGETELLFGPQSFLQTNYEVAAALYEAAGSILQTYSPKSLLDLYCGAGAFALTAGKLVESVTGVDVSADAIACARTAAINNRRTNATFYIQSLESITPEYLRSYHFDAIICNPPRRGLDAATVALIQSLQPQLLLYSSCHAMTLQRDVQMLSGNYRIEHLQAFDMFPFTKHFEVLAVLCRHS